MKTTLRHYGPVAVLLAVILLVATCLSLLMGGRKQDDRPRVLVTTYPLYVAAQNILGDTHEVELTLLSGAGAGCLHDYQLTPADRLAVERAEMVIVNGAGAEPFLDGLVEPDRLVDASENLDLICAENHHHEDEEHHHGIYNEHVWLSPTGHFGQTLNILSALCDLDSTNSVLYNDNAMEYIKKIAQINDRIMNSDLYESDRPCILFHNSLAYLAADVGLDVKLTLTADGESGLSAADLAQVERLAAEHPDLILLYDNQYPIRYGAVDGLVPAQQVISLETAVVGDGNPSDWLDAMTRNVHKLQALTEGGDTP